MELLVPWTKLGAGSRVALTAALVIWSFGASAGTITLSGTGQMYWTAQYLGTSGGNIQSTATPTGPVPTGNTYSLAVPGQYTFQDQFSTQQSSPLVGPSNAALPSSVGPYSFQDTYEFSVTTPATGDVLAVSLALGPPFQNTFDISDLQFRLYEVPSPVPSPGLTIPSGSRVITLWQGQSGNDNGQAITANFSNVQSGTYFLDIAGTANGTSGGTYVGQLNLNPVPLPAALPLLLSGVAGLGVMMSRRRSIALA